MLDPLPNIPVYQTFKPGEQTNAVKIATPDLIIFDEDLPVDGLAQILFEDLSAHELINITRSEVIDGQNVSYNLIGNVRYLQDSYNTQNIFDLTDTNQKYFKNFGISFSIHVPETGTGPEGQRTYIVEVGSAVANRGDLVIDVVNMKNNERVDIEILNSGQALGDTIYVEES